VIRTSGTRNYTQNFVRQCLFGFATAVNCCEVSRQISRQRGAAGVEGGSLRRVLKQLNHTSFGAALCLEECDALSIEKSGLLCPLVNLVGRGPPDSLYSASC
jgi:hypothetical protein